MERSTYSVIFSKKGVIERHDAPSDRVEMKGLHPGPVTAGL